MTHHDVLPSLDITSPPGDIRENHLKKAKRNPATTVVAGFLLGTPEGTRTPSLQNRNLTLYPIALRAHLRLTQSIIYYSGLFPVCKEKFFNFAKIFAGGREEGERSYSSTQAVACQGWNTSRWARGQSSSRLVMSRRLARPASSSGREKVAASPVRLHTTSRVLFPSLRV